MNPSLVGGLIAAIVIVVLIVLGFIYGPKLLASRRTADQTTTAPPAAVPVQPTASGQSSNHASGLDPVKLDDAFYKKLSSTLEQGNAAWQPQERIVMLTDSTCLMPLFQPPVRM